MNRQALLGLYDTQLRIGLEQPGIRKDVFSQLVRFIRSAPGMNVVSYSHLDETDLDAIIEEQVGYFSQLNQPFPWHVCDHDKPTGLKDRLVAHGFEPEDDPDAVLVLDVQEAAPALIAPISAEIRPVTRREGLGDVVWVEQVVLGATSAGSSNVWATI